MPGMVQVQLDERRLKRIERSLRDVPFGMEKAISRAINKVAVAARTLILRMITGQIAVTQRDLRRRSIRLRKASFGKLFAVVSVRGGRIPLSRFGARQTRRGVTYRIRKTGGRSRIDGAFLATMPGGHTGVFLRRADESQPGGRVRRLPIDEKFGPSVPEVFTNIREVLSGTFERLLGERLDGEVTTQVNLILTRHRKESRLVPI